MTLRERPETYIPIIQAKQKLLYESGNEMAAYAARQINYHVMGYYPITPSTQIAELLDQMGADGEHHIAMIPAEGEHSAAGICFGAAAGGGRVFNASSANGLLYALRTCLFPSFSSITVMELIAAVFRDGRKFTVSLTVEEIKE